MRSSQKSSNICNKKKITFLSRSLTRGSKQLRRTGHPSQVSGNSNLLLPIFPTSTSLFKIKGLKDYAIRPQMYRSATTLTTLFMRVQ